MTVLNTTAQSATVLLLCLGFWTLAVAQEAAEKTDEPDEAAAPNRKQPTLPESAEYVNLPEVIAVGKRWRLDDDVKEALWRAEVRQEALNLREREYRERFREGAVSTSTSSGGRFKAEFLPFYDPENARVIDMGVDQSRSEVVELFKGRF